MTQEGTGKRRLVAVVVTHNRLAQLRVTLKRLLEAPPEALEAVLVVDNASSDGTEAYLAQLKDPRLSLHREAQNGGGAGGFAIGMDLAQKRFDPDWIVVMDDDARPEPGALEAFVTADLGDLHAAAAAVYLPDGQICEMNRPSRNPFWHPASFLRTLARGRAGFHLGPEAYESDAPRPIDVTSFVGFFISRRGLQIAGLPDPGLFLYGDDGLYTLGLVRAGGRMAFLPQIRFEHDLTTFEGQRGRFRPLWKVYYYHRNLLMLYRTAAGWLFWPALLVVLPKWISKVRHHGGARRQFLVLLWRALRDGLAFRTDVPHAQVLDWTGQD